MREFFHGWRRKLGCVILLMACASMVGWLRSQVYHDDLKLFFGKHTVNIRHSYFCDPALIWTWESNNVVRVGEGVFRRVLTRQGHWVLIIFSRSINWNLDSEIIHREEGEAAYCNFGDSFPDAIWIWNWQGFRCAVQANESRAIVLSAPYWSIVLSMTLLSAYLLLGKPRKAAKMEPLVTQN